MVKTVSAVISSFVPKVAGTVALTLVKLSTYALKLCHRAVPNVNDWARSVSVLMHLLVEKWAGILTIIVVQL